MFVVQIKFLLHQVQLVKDDNHLVVDQHHIEYYCYESWFFLLIIIVLVVVCDNQYPELVQVLHRVLILFLEIPENKYNSTKENS
jgi:hypothetical protein